MQSAEKMIGQALLRLPLIPARKTDLSRWAKLLASLARTEAVARRPSRFRQTSIKAGIKELRAFAAQTDRLRRVFDEKARGVPTTGKRLSETARKLHQTSIVALADAGFLARDEILDLALSAAAGKLARFSAKQTKLLAGATTSARKAIETLRTRPVSDPAATRGAPTADLATAAAGIAYSAYVQLTGKKPTVTVASLGYGHRASGPFISLIAEILPVLDIQGSPEALARKAIRQGRNLIKTTKISE